MTGPEHFKEAERLLEEFGREFEIESDAVPVFIAQVHAGMTRAQVHATLALAAATALGREGEGRTQPSKDRAAWFDAAAECKKGAAA